MTALASAKTWLAGLAAFGLALAVFLMAAPDAVAAASKQESRCAAKLNKSAQKLAKLIAKEEAKCRRKEIAGKISGPCPSAAQQGRIDAAQAASRVVAAKECKSTCSVSSTIECVSDDSCPPLGAASERCSAGAANRPFDMRNLGFPGSLCPGLLGRTVEQPADLGDCVAQATAGGMGDYVALVYGSTSAASGLSADAAKCQAAIEKASRKLLITKLRGVSKCRLGILKGRRATNPSSCVSDDPKLSRKIKKAEKKLRSFVDARCNTGMIGMLDLCGNGPGGTLTQFDAETCLIAAIDELVDSSKVPVERSYSSQSLIEAMFPPAPVCGDNQANQLPDAFLLLGEECDGTDDAACPGACLPPGDMFECTCANVARLRFFGNLTRSETDAGWTGLSHDQRIADKSGYVTELSNCDCTAFSGATCTGASSDPVCDVYGATAPSCSWDLHSTTRCDAHGNGDGFDEDADCYICDANSANAGAACRQESDCQSQCYDATGTVTGGCASQDDCNAGSFCRGRCDKNETCLISPNGAPLSVNAAGAAVCAVQSLITDIVGTRDLITGAHELFYEIRSRVHTAESVTRPCPVCGGFCEGGRNDLAICKGRCDVSGGACRFNSDCPSGESCSPDSPDCPGGECQLSLVCGADPGTNPFVIGKPCRIEFEDPIFGTMSSDCQPSPTVNVSGAGGMTIQYLPATSAAISLPSTVPCTAEGFQLYDCPCPDDGGQPTAPNTCTPACNAAGANFGVGCADGNGAGSATVCAAGANAGQPCDEDADCPQLSCSQNPRHCSGDPAFERYACQSNADCGLGACQDACPGGRCVPLCVPSAADPYDGVCAAGPPLYHCDGTQFTARTCLKAAAESICEATCESSGASCRGDSDCAAGEACLGSCELARDCEAGADGILGTGDDFPDAGICIPAERDCFLDPLIAEGGSTLNGQGDPTNASLVSLFCFKRIATNAGFNATSGFGGPGRVRVRGTNVPNFAHIP